MSTPIVLDPIELGMALFTLVEPHRGYEVEYNRWYERDHFYAGCMIGADTLSGARFVATRDLKALRYPDPSPVTPDPSVGTYLALYWVLAGRTEEWNDWAVRQVNGLHGEGRMQAHRDHIHTVLYDYDWAVARDADGVPPTLALDHRFAGLVAVVGEAAGGDREQLDAHLRAELLPTLLAGSPAALCLSFTPRPLRADAPADVVRVPIPPGRFLHLYFLDADPAEAWAPAFAGLGERLAGSGLGQVVWASPFRPTVPGTDQYTDQLW